MSTINCIIGVAALMGHSFGYTEGYAHIYAVCSGNEAHFYECYAEINKCVSRKSAGVICEGM